MEGRRRLHIAGIGAVLLMLGVTFIRPSISVPGRSSSEPDTRPVITLDEFERIETGMTYKQCVAIIGERGIPFGSSTDAAEPTPDVEWISVAWHNAEDSSAEISFNFGKVARKLSFNLE